MEKKTKLFFILCYIVLLIPFYNVKALIKTFNDDSTIPFVNDSVEPYEMQKTIKIDYELNIKYKTRRKYFSSSSEELIEKTKSNYGYNDLLNRSNPEGRRQLYNELYRLYSGLYGFSDNISATNIDGENYYFLGEVDITSSGLNLSTKEAIDTYYIFRHDNPLFYYSSNVVVYSDAALYVSIFDEYSSGSVRSTYEAAIADALDIYEAEANQYTDEYSKVLAVHNYLCNHMRYVLNGNNYEHNIIGVLVENKGVCEAYARTFELILNYLNIDNVLVTGMGDNGTSQEAHAWNLVKIGNYYYWVDVTWDDYDPIEYTFFLLGNRNWSRHTPNTPETTDFLYSLPEVSDIKITYQGIEVLENNISLGKVNNSVEAYDKIVELDNSQAEYELIFDNFNDSTIKYDLPKGNWPEVRNIKLTSSMIELPQGGYATPTINLYDDATLRSDLEITDCYFFTNLDSYYENDYTNVNFNIGSNTIRISGTNIGGVVQQSSSGIFNRIGLNILGGNGSKILVDEDDFGFVMINGDKIVVDTIQGNYFQLNIKELTVNTLKGVNISFSEDYDATINNLYTWIFVPSVSKPVHYNSEGIRNITIGNLYKILEDDPIIRFDSTTDDDATRWANITINGNINTNYQVIYNQRWELPQDFKVLNIGNNTKLPTITWVNGANITDLSNNVHKEELDDVKICYHPETEVVAEIPPTCTEVGYTEGVRCLKTGDIVSGHEEILPLGHNFVDTITPATFDADGLIERVCSICGDVERTIIAKITTIDVLDVQYDGEEKIPSVEVKDANGKVLEIDRDYTLSYENNINVGTARVIINAIGNYAGTKIVDFTIEPANINILDLSIEDQIYTGTPIEPLRSTENYYVTYENNTNVGTAIATITGIGNYVGTRIIEFSIQSSNERLPFNDTKVGAWYYESVKGAYTRGIIKGYDNGNFGVNDKITRGQLVVILYRMEGEADVSSLANPFEDVAEGKYYTDAVKWAYENHIVNGYTATTFGPTDNIKRKDFAVILNNYAKYKSLSVDGSADLTTFADYYKVEGNYSEPAMKWAVANTIINGAEKNGKRYLNPNDNATRAEASAMIMNFINKYNL